ncbi:MAG: D-erythronate dehydrogenase [Cyanobacteria bacterium J06634_6]
MNIIITGGAGFLGQRLASFLLDTPNLQRLTLADIVLPTAPGKGDKHNDKVRCVQTDLTSYQATQDLITSDTTAVFHLAAVVSAQAEANFDLGVQVNVQGTRNLLEAMRHNAPGAMLIFASSLAVFGGDLPEMITDGTAVTPQSSYGTQKAIAELWVNDYARKGFIDGRVLRLPTVCVRPGKPNAAASSFASSIIREPLHGQQTTCPVDVSLPLWLSSPEAVTHNLAHVLSIPAERFESIRALNLPGITVTVAEMIEALRAVAGEEVTGRIDYQIEQAISDIVATWPSRFDTTTALDLGFEGDRTFEDIIRAFMASSVTSPS